MTIPKPKQKKLWSLRTAARMLAGGCILLFTLMLFLVFYRTMPQMLLDTESKYLTEQREVVAGLFQSAQDNAYTIAEDIAVWEDTVRFVEGEYPDYIKDSWPDTSLLEAYQYNFIIFRDADGNEVYSEFYDYMEGLPMARPVGLDEELAPLAGDVLRLYDGGPLPADSDVAGYGLGGIAFHAGQPYLVASMPVMSNRSTARPVGTVTLGAGVDTAYFQHLSNFSTVNFAWDEHPDEDTLADEDSIQYVRDDRVLYAITYTDIEGNPVQLHMTDTRPIYTQGQQEIDRTMLHMLIMVVVLAFALFLIVESLFLKPVERLTHELAGVGDEPVDASGYVGNQEFTTLCGSINDMLVRLKESQMSMQTFGSILNGMDALIYVTDPETDEILFINQHMCNAYGVAGDGEALGKHCWQVLQAGQSSRCDFCPVYQLEKEPGARVEWEEHSSLTGRHYKNIDSLIEWPDGRMVHLQYSQDVTEMKLAEETLTRRLAQQQMMARMAQSFISTEDKDTLISAAISMAGEFTGSSKVLLARIDYDNNLKFIDNVWYNPNETVQPLSSDVYPYVPGEAMFRDIEAGKGYSADDDVRGLPGYEVLARDGVISTMSAPILVDGAIWGLLSFDECSEVHPWSESDIQLLEMIAGVISGMVARSKMEKQLVLMSSIVESSPQYISFLDTEGKFAYINPAIEALSGYTADEIMDRGIDILYTPEDRARILEDYVPLTLRGETVKCELPMQRKDGGERIMRHIAFQVKADVEGVAAIATDVTEQRQLERDLVAAKEQAEQSNLAKSNFLSRMSHEMRTPMNAVIGMTGIARATADPKRKEYCLDKIDEASSHLLGVINDILDVSKIEAGKFELSVSEFSFERMLQRVTGVMNFRIDEKHQDFVVRIDPSVPGTVIADEQRLAQVITNLLSNAVKFTPEDGTISLSVRAEAYDGDEYTLLVEVADTGIGISPEQQKRLFTSFEQADGGISRKYGGTGLGLAISKSIVELMGGEIWIESELGQGSRFLFRAKVRRGDSRPAQGGQAINWDELRILAVDDGPGGVGYFQELSTSLGFECQVAESGHAARRVLRENTGAPFNIIFVDLRMPEMDGIELTRHIKREHGEHTVVIMISAAQIEEIEAEARDAGVDAFIAKPLFASLVVDCVNNCLGGRRTTAPAEAPDSANCFEGKHILLAEDIEINREIVEAMLEGTGAIIESAGNGAEAVEMFSAAPAKWDMVLMDIHMPEMDGFEATRRIRALDLPEALTVPIVAMTANVFKEDIIRCLAAGMDDHIGKPVDAAELVTKMRQHLHCTGIPKA